MRHKVKTNKYLHWPILSIAFALLITTIGCSKNDEILEGDNKVPQLVIRVEGVSGDANFSPANTIGFGKTSKIANTKSTIHQTGNVVTEIENNAGFSLDATTVHASIGATEKLPTNINTISNGISPIAANSPMGAGKTYRILIYRNDEPKLWKTLEAKAGQPINLVVEKNDTYKWFAYSYNNEESLPEPADLENPKVDAPIDKDLLYASGQITIPNTPVGQKHVYPIAILFQHKMTQIKVRIDGLHLARYAKINGLKASFSESDYLKSGTFDIKGNTMGNLNTVPTTEIFNTGAQPNNLWEAVYYTADPSKVNSYKVKITDLPVTFDLVDPAIADVNIATFSNSQVPLPNLEKTFNFTSPAEGQSLFAAIGLSYTLPSKRIIHMANGTDFGYAMQRDAGWKLINDLRNFGNLNSSLVRMQPHPSNAGGGVWLDGGVNDNFKNFFIQKTSESDQQELVNILNSTDPNIQPDIVILAAHYYTLRDPLITALTNYVNKGGVFIHMYEGIHSSGIELIRRIMEDNSLTQTSLPADGTMYPIVSSVNDRVTNGPFGDVRLEHWGEDSAGCTGIEGLNTNDATIYSYGQGFNRSFNARNAAAVSMFRHKRKNYFYLGDGGLTSYREGNDSYLICPYKFDPATGRPVPKPYGNGGNGYTPGSRKAYNGIIAGNVILWAGQLSEFNGIKKWRYKN